MPWKNGAKVVPTPPGGSYENNSAGYAELEIVMSYRNTDPRGAGAAVNRL